MTAGYSGTPLPKKLGIAPGSRVLVLGNSLDFDPAGLAVAIESVPAGSYDVVLLFCPDAHTLVELFERAKSAHTVPGALWVCWLKKSSRISTDLGETAVREYGLANGRVDVKVAAIDANWSGLKFVTRLVDR